MARHYTGSMRKWAANPQADASRINTAYQSGLRARGQVMVNYDLLGLGKSTTITVTFEADGLASGAIPMFDS